MILSSQTLSKFGYTPESLSENSGKVIVVQCDYCGEAYEPRQQSRNINFNRGIIKKDACKSCGQKKRIEMEIATHGENWREVAFKSQRVAMTANSKKLVEASRIARSKQTKEDKIAIAKKSFQTYFEKTGFAHPSQNPEVKKKKAKTLIDSGNGAIHGEKCSKTWSRKTPEEIAQIQDKAKQTYLANFGVEHPSLSPIFIAKKEAAHLAKYGVKNPMQRDEVKQKAVKSRDKNTDRKASAIQALQSYKAKTGFDSVLHNPDIQKLAQDAYITNIDAINDKRRKTRLSNGTTRLIDGKTIKEWASEKLLSPSHTGAILRDLGEDALRDYDRKQTNIETLIDGVLRDIGANYKSQVSFGTTYRADFMIDDKFVIECDGLYFHSDCRKLDRRYHQKKMNFYKEKELIPLFFRSDEIFNKLNIIKSIICNKIGISTHRVAARKCKIIEGFGSQFFNENHLMGAGAGKQIGLEFDGHVIGGMQIKLINSKESIWEVSRFCTLPNTSIIGGYSRILKTFINKYHPKKIVNFIDMRYGSGLYLENLGFSYEGEYLSFKWTNGKETFHRMSFPGNSGYAHGLNKIWDCGQAKWLWSAPIN